MNIRSFLLISMLSASVTSALAMERTFALIKPDMVEAKKSGEIITIIEANGFEILGLHKEQFEDSEVEELYAAHKKKPFFKDLKRYMQSGPVVAMVLEKKNAIADWRKLMGATNPENAEYGTIRNRFCSSIDENGVHGSDGPEAAKNEIEFFFEELDWE